MFSSSLVCVMQVYKDKRLICNITLLSTVVEYSLSYFFEWYYQFFLGSLYDFEYEKNMTISYGIWISAWCPFLNFIVRPLKHTFTYFSFWCLKHLIMSMKYLSTKKLFNLNKKLSIDVFFWKLLWWETKKIRRWWKNLINKKNDGEVAQYQNHCRNLRSTSRKWTISI